MWPNLQLSFLIQRVFNHSLSLPEYNIQTVGLVSECGASRADLLITQSGPEVECCCSGWGWLTRSGVGEAHARSPCSRSAKNSAINFVIFLLAKVVLARREYPRSKLTIAGHLVVLHSHKTFELNKRRD